MPLVLEGLSIKRIAQRREGPFSYELPSEVRLWISVPAPDTSGAISTKLARCKHQKRPGKARGERRERPFGRYWLARVAAVCVLSGGHDPACSPRDQTTMGLRPVSPVVSASRPCRTSTTSPLTLALGTPPVCRTSATTVVTRLSAISGHRLDADRHGEHIEIGRRPR
jgi:hypothetical protein